MEYIPFLFLLFLLFLNVFPFGYGNGNRNGRNGQIWLPFDRLHHYYSDIHEYSTINELKSDQSTDNMHSV